MGFSPLPILCITTGRKLRSVFTGIVQGLAKVASFDGHRLTLACPPIEEPWNLGESIAVNGCCLTLVALQDGQLVFELSKETLGRTALGQLRTNSAVNIERALKMGDRLGGHWVQGHVDTIGHLESASENAQSHVMVFRVPQGCERYLIDKGSIAIDGVSLTVVEPTGSRFEVAIIPHTWEHTNLSRLKVGDAVNLEFDVLAKYVERIASGP